MRTPAAAALLSLTLVGCPSLDDIPLGVCGNGVVEASLGEECDTPPEASDEDASGARCAPPGHPSECHFVWDASACCPAGAEPGGDGRCRRPSRAFEEEPWVALAEVARTADAADLDGDEWPELALSLDNDDVQIRAFDGEEVSGQAVIQRARDSDLHLAALGAPRPRVVGACEGSEALSEGPSSLLLPSGAGVRLFLGRPGPSLLSKPLSAFETRESSLVGSLPLGACVRPSGVGELLPEDLRCPATLAEIGGALEVYAVLLGQADESDGSAQDPLGPEVRRHVFEGQTLADLAEQPRVVRLPAWGGCDGLATWFAGGPSAGEVVVVGLCDPELDWDDQHLGRVLSRTPVPAGARPTFLDASGDGLLDLVLVDGSLARVLEGDGAGAFAIGATPATRVPQVPGAGDDAPIAAGFIDDDGALDFVHAYAAWLSNGSCEPEGDVLACDHDLAAVLLPGDAALWTEAAIVDLDGDGRNDVVTTRVAQAGGNHAVDVLRQGFAGVLNAAPLPTSGPPRWLTLEDFDGDAAMDVAWVVPGEVPCVDRDRLDVLHGGDAAASPTLVAELLGIVGVAAAPLVVAPDTFDGVGDLGVASRCPTEDGRISNRVAVLLGSTARRFDVPFPLGSIDDARTAFVGAERDGDGHPDLVGLVTLAPTTDEQEPAVPLGVVTLRALGDAELAPAQPVPTTALPLAVRLLPDDGIADVLGVRSLLPLRAAIAAGPLLCTSGDAACASDVAVFVSSEALAAGVDRDAPRLAVLPAAGGEPTLHPAEPEGCGVQGGAALPEVLSEEVLDLAGYAPTLKRTRLLLVDLDGDGHRDAVGWWSGPRAVQGGSVVDETATGGAVVFWNGEGGFGGRCPEPIPMPEGEAPVRILPLSGGLLEPTILLVTGRAARVLRPGATRALGACADGDEDRCAPALPDDVTSASPIRDAALLDVDHDGLDDLALVSADAVRIFRQRSRDEVAASAP